MFIKEMLLKSLLHDPKEEEITYGGKGMSAEEILKRTNELYKKVDLLSKRCYNELEKNPDLVPNDYDWFEVKLHVEDRDDYNDPAIFFSTFIEQVDAESTNVLKYVGRKGSVVDILRNEDIKNELIVDDLIDFCEIYLCIPFDKSADPWVKLIISDEEGAEDLQILFPSLVYTTHICGDDEDECLEEDLSRFIVPHERIEKMFKNIKIFSQNQKMKNESSLQTTLDIVTT